MKKLFIPLFLLMICLQACGFKEREQNLQEREKELAQKQQELLLLEQRLFTKDQELNQREQLIDSTEKEIDSASLYKPEIIGKWVVRMNCTETSCEGSAIGDTKTEQWEISYSNNSVIAKAYSEKKLIRIYNGSYTLVGLQLFDENRIRVNLHVTTTGKMEGTREILQEKCKIIYSLSTEKIK